MFKKPISMLAAFLLVTLLFIPFYRVSERNLLAPLTVLDNGWTVSAHGMELAEADTIRLRDTGLLPLKKDDVLTLSHLLPEDMTYEQPSIHIRTHRASLRVFVDGAEIFSHDEVRTGERNYPEWGSHYIGLPADCGGKLLTVELCAFGNAPFGGVEHPLIGNYADLLSYHTRQHLLALVASLFLCVYGVIFIFISLFFTARMPSMREHIFSAMICLIAGIWLLCHHEFISPLLQEDHPRILEYFLQFSVVPVFYAYLLSLHLPLNRTWHRVLAVVLSVISVGALFVEFLLGLHLHFLLFVYAPLLLLGFSLAVRTIYTLIREGNGNSPQMVQMFGLAALVVSCTLHVLLYYLQDYYGIERTALGRYLMTIGVSVFLEAQLIHFFLFVSHRFAEDIAVPELEEMAYRDFLTKLPNRTDAERVFAGMKGRTDDYCMVMFDLNHLKEVNDTAGHPAGDRLLTEFAGALRIAFGGGAYLTRIGGDEFIALLEGETETQVNRRLQTLDEILRKLSERDAQMAHSAAYGYAFRRECAGAEDEVHAVRALADKRMYERKRVMKQ